MGILLSKVLFQSTPLPTHIPQVNIDHQKNLQLKDRISELPDDLFAAILSHLPLKEVARTSVISHRWRHLWKVTPHLDLDDFKSADKYWITDADKLSYVEWVNWIVESYEGGKLHKIRICYGLDKHFKRDIDKWVKFAFSKQVQSFDLQMLTTSSSTVSGRENYSLTRELVETFVNGKFNGFQYLKSLNLKQVNVNDDLVEFILNNSPVLEQLSIKGSSSLSTVRLCGPQCVLKCLEVTYFLESLEINDVASLVSLTYSGELPKKLTIKNVPSLIEFRFAGSMVIALFDLKLNGLFDQFSSSLKSLTLDISDFVDFKNYKSLPKMTALEKLVVQTSNSEPYTAWYASFVKLCPFLTEFVFQAHCHDHIALSDGKIMITKGHPHESLKKVKILGYYGCTRDVQIALYFIHNAVSLDTIVIDPHDQSPFFHGLPPNTEIESAARIRAKKQLKRKVPSRVKIVFL